MSKKKIKDKAFLLNLIMHFKIYSNSIILNIESLLYICNMLELMKRKKTKQNKLNIKS